VITTGLDRQAVVEADVGAHLHFKEHQRQVLRAGLATDRPEHPIEAMAARFEF
jgi:hypothetical protein